MTAEEDARGLLDRYWDDLLDLDPLLGTQIGDERFDDRLPDPTDAGRERRIQIQEAALRDAASIDHEGLDDDVRSGLDVLEAIARRDLADATLRLDRLAAVSHLWGPGVLLSDLASIQRADTPERLQRYAARLRALPDYLAAIEDVARDGIDAGVTAPELVVDRSLAQVERLLALHPADSPALEAVPPEDADGRAAIEAVIRDEVNPAYERYVETLRVYRPHATQTIGLPSLPDGDRLYASQILAWTTLPMEAGEAHALGEAELTRIQQERRKLASALGFDSPEAAIEAHDAGGNNRADSKEALLRRAEEQVQRSWDAAPAFFGRLPEASCEVRLVEEFREADMPMAFYMPPTADGSRAGTYYVNGYKTQDQPLHLLATTSYHEANPGHHFQISLEQEMPDRHPILRFGGFLAGSAFTEGWGLYSERLADEMDLFADDYERLGMLAAEAFRAARLVVDTGIHAFGWDRERAVDTLVSSGLPRGDAEIEVDRYITLPGQALSYKVGQLEIMRLREEATSRGETPRDFHDRLLALGSLPLVALRGRMTASENAQIYEPGGR